MQIAVSVLRVKAQLTRNPQDYIFDIHNWYKPLRLASGIFHLQGEKCKPFDISNEHPRIPRNSQLGGKELLLPTSDGLRPNSDGLYLKS